MRNITLILLLVLSLSSIIESQNKDEEKRIKLIEKISPTVVSVMSLSMPGGGSGVLIDPYGTVLTNFHVVARSIFSRGKEKPGFMKCGTPDGALRRAKIIGIDPGGDLAVIRLIPKKNEKNKRFPYAEIGTQNDIKIGDFVLAMGNPFLLATDFNPTITLGIISGLHRYMPGIRGKLIYSDCIQTDAPINPGNSGGPLFNMEGKVVGINGRISIGERGRVNVGVGFAVSGDIIKRFLPDLRAGKLCSHGSLRLDSRDMEEGLVVVAIEEDGPAWEAGIRIGDILISLDGIKLKGQNDLLNRITSIPAGWPVTIVWQDKNLKKIHKSWVRLAPITPEDPKLADWEPVDLDEILKFELKRIEKNVFSSLGINKKTFSIPRKTGKKLISGSYGFIKKYPPPKNILPEKGVVFPPFSSSSEYDGGERIGNKTALVILLPGEHDEKLFIDSETYIPLGTSYSYDELDDEIRILISTWQNYNGLKFPKTLIWKYKGKKFLEEEIYFLGDRKK